MRKSLKDFTGLYQIQRTLQFQLKPVGKTDEYIQQRGLISVDEARAEKYKKVKKIIDRRHKQFIDEVLEAFRFSQENLTEYVKLYGKKDKTADEINAFSKLRSDMRKAISKAFKKSDGYKLLAGKELIKSNLESVLQDDAERTMVHEFDQWSSYFKGFSENRENMYSDENKASAIGFRIVEQNLPKYLDNIRAYKKCIELAGQEIFSSVSPIL